MNFYEHHLGDYLRDTAHLSMLEDAAYRRLLDVYYVREQPLPLDVKQCCKLARAQTAAEKRAVFLVLSEFFKRTEDGYHQARADDEISRYQDKRSKAKASADARWTHTEGSTNALPTQSERNANASRPHSGGNAPQSPVPNINPKRPVDNGDKSDAPQKDARAPNGAGASKGHLPGGVVLTPADLKRLKPEVAPGAPRFPLKVPHGT